MSNKTFDFARNPTGFQIYGFVVCAGLNNKRIFGKTKGIFDHSSRLGELSYNVRIRRLYIYIYKEKEGERRPEEMKELIR